MVQYSFTSTETRRLVRTATSTLTQLLNYDVSSEGERAILYHIKQNNIDKLFGVKVGERSFIRSVLLYVHRDRTEY